MMATSPRKTPRSAALRVAAVAEPGAILDEKYRVESVLGSGGMAVVVAATHLQLGHRVAIKLLQPEALGSADVVARVLREARALASLKSDHVTRVLDVGELDSGAPFIVMELHEGEDLARYSRRVGRLPLRDAASFLVQACDAIAEAHAAGIVHRDIKPSNLFLTRRRDGSPVVKLMDFGISKPIDPLSDDSLTTAHASLGTPHYMSPEQFLSAREVDGRTDVWSLGVVLYVLLTGEHPFDAPTVPALHLAIASTPPTKLRTVAPDAPEAIEHLILRCLEKSVEQRLPSVERFAAALIPFADDDTQRRFAHLQRSEPVDRPTTPACPGERSSKNRLGIALAVAAGVAILAFLVYHTLMPSRSTTARPQPSATQAQDARSQNMLPPLPPSVASIASSVASPQPATSASVPAKKTPSKSRIPSTSDGRDPYEERR